MDHLPLPSNPTHSCPRVPYVSLQPYDGGPFLHYPERRPLSNSSSITELESFLQTWLYFGLLHEVLGQEFRLEGYLRDDDEGSRVCSTFLLRDLGSWINQAREWNTGFREEKRYHLACCLNAVSSSMFALHTSSDGRFNRGIRQSIAALGETVSMAVRLALGPNSPITIASFTTTYIDDRVRHTMQQYNWCPSEAAAALTSFYTIATVHFVSMMSKPSLGISHQQCTENRCYNVLNNAATYRPLHVDDRCDCECIGPDMNDIVACCLDGTYPVLHIVGESVAKISVKALPFQENTPYVALSHVWADGLGNPEATTLPRCQLLRIRSLVENLREHQPWIHHDLSDLNERPLLVWCDTLCCPVEPHLKPFALEKMRDVYKQAAYVLVLDKSLLLYDLNTIGVLEASMRLLTARWIGRLWTLQEAVLAKNLLIQFRDFVIDLKSIVIAAEDGYGADLRSREIASDVAIVCKQIRGFFNAPGDIGDVLVDAMELVRHRRVTYQTDEPLCLATLFQLDLGEIVRAQPDDRMSMFWSMMPHTRHGIPKDIIFNNLPRIERVGFRWAPSSLMQEFGNRRGLPTLSHKDDSDSRASLYIQQGLRVKYPAWRLRIPAVPPSGTPLNFWTPFNTSPENELHLRHHDGCWYTVERVPEGPIISPDRSLWDLVAPWKELTLVLGELPERSQLLGYGLVTGVLKNGIGEEILHSITIVAVRKEKEKSNRLWEAALTWGCILREEANEILQRETKPTVDVALLEQLTDRPLELANQALQDPTLAELAEDAVENRSNKTIGPHDLFSELMIDRCIGRYLTTTAEYPPDTAWIVD